MWVSAMLERYREWRARAEVFRDLKKLQREDAAYDAFDKGSLIGRVKAAAFQNRPAAGLDAWRQLRIRAPDLAITSANALRSMMELGHFDVVERALTEALEKYPGAPALLRLHAELAHRQGHWDDACARWEAFRKCLPDDSAGYSFGAICLAQAGRIDEAGDLLARRLRSVPTDVVSATEYARLAERLGNMDAALERWRALQGQVRDVAAWVGEAKALMQLGREEDALRVLEQAKIKFQGTPIPDIEISWIIQARGDKEVGLRQWAKVRAHYPYCGVAYLAPAWLLRDLGRRDEAEALLLNFVERDTDESEPTVEYARFAQGRDWPEAARRWALVRDRYPDREEGYTWGADALEAIGDHEEAAVIRSRKP